MIDKAMWDALWRMSPEEMATMCVLTVACGIVIAVCVVALIGSMTGYGKEEETWLN